MNKVLESSLPKLVKKVSNIAIYVYECGTFSCTFPNGGGTLTNELLAVVEAGIKKYAKAKEQAARAKTGPEKQEDFEENVRTDYYSFNPFDFGVNRDQWRIFGNQRGAEFSADAIQYLVDSGVPEKYANKVYSCAWDRGHSNGYYEVLGVMYGLIEIFKP